MSFLAYIQNIIRYCLEQIQSPRIRKKAGTAALLREKHQKKGLTSLVKRLNEEEKKRREHWNSC
jgi:hypothetical protein